MTTLIDELLAEQKSLTAVARFAREHERGAGPAQARYYRDLIPLEKPKAGEQYAFAVDLDACTGCKACVSACHSLNGLDEGEAWRDVGLIVGGSTAEPYLQTVTTACHHCVDPGCLLGCPVAAYEKDAVTGIVRHLDDQCIGCEYCILKCPYDVPKYSKKRGIVRKCDMCHQRLAADEAPACVQACPNGAITIRLVETAEARAQAVPGVRLIHGAFESSYTKPTTSYTTRKGIPSNAHPGDVYRLRLEHPHWPLIAMLLLSQLSAGLCVFHAGTTFLSADLFAKVGAPIALAAFFALNAGLVLAVFHLGKPSKAWRFFLGLRTSWMSREILVFNVFAATAGLLALAGMWPWIADFAARMGGGFAASAVEKVFHLASSFVPAGVNAITVLSFANAGLALTAIFTSAMIYIDTRRPFWSARLTFPKFFGTTLVLGASAAATLLGALQAWRHELGALPREVAAVALLLRVLYAAWDATAFRAALLDPHAPAHRSAKTIWRLLRPQFRLRSGCVVLAIAAGGVACFASGPLQIAMAVMSFGGTLTASVVERYCFFTASDAPRMPGGIST